MTALTVSTDERLFDLSPLKTEGEEEFKWNGARGRDCERSEFQLDRKKMTELKGTKGEKFKESLRVQGILG